MSAELATVSFRTQSGLVEDESWTVVGFAIACATGDRRPGLGSVGEAGREFGYPVGPVLLAHPETTEKAQVTQDEHVIRSETLQIDCHRTVQILIAEEPGGLRPPVRDQVLAEEAIVRENTLGVFSQS